METLLDTEQVVSLIPQKAPFVMIDKLVSSDDVSSTSGLTITEDNIFTQDGEFIEPGLIENIAQTGAIRAGYAFSKLKEENNDLEPPVGYIGAIKNLIISKLPKVGDHIKTTLSIENQVFDITMVKGEVELNGEIIASCQMKIFVQNSGDMPS
jgi:3-hydroxyacyl-[acyl-carrier-protein] dehydratase